MAVKSIIEVDVNDARFKEFTALYAKYEAALTAAPGKWADVNKQIDSGAKAFEVMAAAMLAQTEVLSDIIKNQQAVTLEVEKQGRAWAGVSKWARGVYGDIEGATKFLMRWSPLITGALGAGGLYGIDRLAGSAAAGRRSSLGTGTTYGEQEAFRVNFSRLVDPDSFLHGIAGAKLDVEKSAALRGLGITSQQLGGNTADLAVSTLDALKNLADTTNPALYGQQIGARRLGGIATPEDLLRLRNTGGAEYAALRGGFGRDRGGLDLPPETQKAWQELSTQLTRAGATLETTLIKGLVPLAPAIEKVSTAFADFASALLASPDLKKWIKDVADGFETLASWFNTPSKFKDLIFGPRDSSGIVDRGARALYNYATGSYDAPLMSGGGGATMPLPSMGGLGLNNPGNLRRPGQTIGFASFNSGDEGVRAIARQLRLYGNRDHLDTVAGIIGKYAPPSENNTAAYIADVSKRTGFGPGQHLNVNDPETLAKLVAAIVRNEQKPGKYDQYKDNKIVVQIIGTPPGGDPIVSVNGLNAGTPY